MLSGLNVDRRDLGDVHFGLIDVLEKIEDLGTPACRLFVGDVIEIIVPDSADRKLLVYVE